MWRRKRQATVSHRRTRRHGDWGDTTERIVRFASIPETAYQPIYCVLCGNELTTAEVHCNAEAYERGTEAAEYRPICDKCSSAEAPELPFPLYCEKCGVELTDAEVYYCDDTATNQKFFTEPDQVPTTPRWICDRCMYAEARLYRTSWDEEELL